MVWILTYHHRFGVDVLAAETAWSAKLLMARRILQDVDYKSNVAILEAAAKGDVEEVLRLWCKFQDGRVEPETLEISECGIVSFGAADMIALRREASNALRRVTDESVDKDFGGGY